MPPLKILKQPVTKPIGVKLRRPVRTSASTLPHHQTTLSKPRGFLAAAPKNHIIQVPVAKHLGGSGLLAGLEQAVEDLKSFATQVANEVEEKQDPELNLLIDVFGAMADTVATTVTAMAGPVVGVVSALVYVAHHTEDFVKAFEQASQINKKPVEVKIPKIEPQISEPVEAVTQTVVGGAASIVSAHPTQILSGDVKPILATRDILPTDIKVTSPVLTVVEKQEQKVLPAISAEEPVSYSHALLTNTLLPTPIYGLSQPSMPVSAEVLFTGGQLTLPSLVSPQQSVTVLPHSTHLSIGKLVAETEIILTEADSQSAVPALREKLLDISSTWTPQIGEFFPNADAPILVGNIEEFVVSHTTHSQASVADGSSVALTAAQNQQLAQEAWTDVRTVSPSEMIYPLTAPLPAGPGRVQQDAESRTVAAVLNKALHTASGNQAMSGGQGRNSGQEQPETTQENLPA